MHDDQLYLQVWLDHPTQIDVPLFRALVTEPRICLQVMYCVPSGRELLPVDPEVGALPGWNPDLMEGYSHLIIPATFQAGFKSVLKYGEESARYLAVIQGTNNPAFRGALAGCWIKRRKFLIRYDATIKYLTAISWRDRLKNILLPLIFKNTTYLGYTGVWAKEYLIYFGSKEDQLIWYPYTVDNDWLFAHSQTAREGRHEFLRALNIAPASVVFLVVAKFAPREAPLDVIRAFCEAEMIGADLIVIGDGPQRQEIEAYLAQAANPHIHLLGYLPYDQLPKYYGIADVFIHPAHVECWGVSVNEAMACGLPVLAADTVGAAADLVEEGVNGYCYPHGDTVALGDLMRQCVSKRERLPQMGQVSHRKIVAWGPRETASRLTTWALDI